MFDCLSVEMRMISQNLATGWQNNMFDELLNLNSY